MARPSRIEGPLEGLQAKLGWATLALVLLTVIPFGGNQPVIWTLTGLLVLILFAGQVALSFVRPTAPALRRAALPVGLYAVVIVWTLAQTALPVGSGLAHPLWALAPEGATPYIGADPGQGAHMALRLATYGMIAWILAASALKARRAWAYMMAIAIFSTLLAIYGIAAGLSGVNPVLGANAGIAGQFTATFINRNSYVTYAAFGMVANIACYLHLAGDVGGGDQRAALRNFLETFFSKAWIFAMGALLCGAAVAMTESRGGGAAAVMGLIALIAAYATQRRGGQAALWGVLAAIVGFVVIFMGSGTAERFLADDDAGGGRLIVYAAILENLSERPWLGQGAGAFHDTFRAYLPIEVARAEWNKAHNSYLENIWELGLPMAAVFYAAFVVMFLRLMRGLRVRTSDIGLPAAALAVMVTGGVHSVVDFSLQMPATAALFAVFLGIGWSQSFPRAERASTPRRPARSAI